MNPIVYDEKGTTKAVSLQELFINAHQYDLARYKTQDFAKSAVLLAVIPSFHALMQMVMSMSIRGR